MQAMAAGTSVELLTNLAPSSHFTTAQRLLRSPLLQLLRFKATFSNGDQVLSNWTQGTDACGPPPKPFWLGITCGRTPENPVWDVMMMWVLGSGVGPEDRVL